MKKRFRLVDSSGYASRIGLSWIAQEWGLAKRLRREGLLQVAVPERQTLSDKWGGFRLCREVNR